MSARRYFQDLITVISKSPFVVGVHLGFDEITSQEGYIQGRLELVRGHVLHVAEYVVINPGIQRLKYRYHLQTLDGRLICRWDNAPHHLQLPTFPDHCHSPDGDILSSPPMDLPSVLAALVPLLDTDSEFYSSSI